MSRRALSVVWAVLTACGGSGTTSATTGSTATAGHGTGASSTATSVTGGNSATGVSGVSTSATSGSAGGPSSGSGGLATGSSGASSGSKSSATGATSGTPSSSSTSASATASGSGAGSSSSSSSSSSSGGCTPAQYYASEFQECVLGASASASGQTCTSIPTGADCQTACQSSSQCPDPTTTCSGGSCVQANCTTVFSSCQLSDGTSGTCLPYSENGSETDLCTVNGTAALDAPCDASGFAWPLSGFATPASQLCSAGLVCDLQLKICLPGCDTQTNTCSQGQTCSGSGDLSACVGPSGPYAGGCAPPDFWASEFAVCTQSSQCTCGQECIAQPDGSRRCEALCAIQADCPNPTSVCNGACGESTCTAAQLYTVEPDGATCIPYDVGSNGTEVDFYVVPGTLTQNQSCQGPVPAYPPNDFASPQNNNCTSGLICDPNTMVCMVGCNPQTTPTTCPSGMSCHSVDPLVADIGDCQ